MKVLLVGVGTVGEAIAKLSRGRPWLERMVLADYDLDRARRVQAQVGDEASHPPCASTPRTPRPSRRSRAPTGSTWS